MSLVKVVRDMPLELVDQKRCALSASALVADRVLDLNLVQDGAVVELDKEGVANRSLVRCVVLGAEALVLNAVDLGS
jgi:hypothetical protein